MVEKVRGRDKSIRRGKGKDNQRRETEKVVFRKVHGRGLGCWAKMPRILDHRHSARDYKVQVVKRE